MCLNFLYVCHSIVVTVEYRDISFHYLKFQSQDNSVLMLVSILQAGKKEKRGGVSSL